MVSLVCLDVEVVAYAFLMMERNVAIRVDGGLGMSGQVNVELACQCPLNRCPGIFAPVSSARSAMVMTRR